MAEVAAVQRISRSLRSLASKGWSARRRTKSLLGRTGFLIGCLAPTALDTEMSGAQEDELRFAEDFGCEQARA